MAGDAHGVDGTLLVLEEVDAGPAGRPVVRSVSLTLARGEIAVLLGGNGAGKSTLIRTASGLVPPLAGRVAGPGTRGFDPRFAGVVLEEPQSQFVSGSVRAEIAFALENLGRVAIEGRVRDLLDRFELASLADRDPRTLSAGEQGRALVAAALAPHPRVLFLDDPFLHMGPGSTAHVWRCVRDAVRDGEVEALLLATHDAELAVEAGRVGVLERGRLQAWGSPGTVLRNHLPEAVEPPLGIWLEVRLREAGHSLPGDGLSTSGLVRRILGDPEETGA